MPFSPTSAGEELLDTLMGHTKDFGGVAHRQVGLSNQARAAAVLASVARAAALSASVRGGLCVLDRRQHRRWEVRLSEHQLDVGVVALHVEVHRERLMRVLLHLGQGPPAGVDWKASMSAIHWPDLGSSSKVA